MRHTVFMEGREGRDHLTTLDGELLGLAICRDVRYRMQYLGPGPNVPRVDPYLLTRKIVVPAAAAIVRARILLVARKDVVVFLDGEHVQEPWQIDRRAVWLEPRHFVGGELLDVPGAPPGRFLVHTLAYRVPWPPDDDPPLVSYRIEFTYDFNPPDDAECHAFVTSLC